MKNAVSRRRAAFALCAAMALSQGANAEPFVMGAERDWEFLGQGKFSGSLVKIADGKAHIRMSDGIVRQFWPGAAEGISGSHLQRAMAKLPANPARPAVATGTGPLVNLSATPLAAGALTQWKNSGRLGGAFTAMNQPPRVAEIAGRKAVFFEHAPWLLPLEYQAMVSDFFMPEGAAGSESLTVVATLFNTGAVVDRETFLCWGEKDCGELDTPDFSYGTYEAMQWYDEKLLMPAARFPQLAQWHDFAYVFTPSTSDKNRRDLTLYVDGDFVARRSVKKPNPKLLADNLAFLGCAWEAWWGHKWATRPARPYTGAIASLAIYDRALSSAELHVTEASPVLTATQPLPADGTQGVDTNLLRLSWQPAPDAASQVLHFGTDSAAVAGGTAQSVKLKAGIDQAYIPIDLKLPALAAAQSYFWRVEPVFDAKNIAPQTASVATAPWTFRTEDYALEYDGPVSEPFPATVPQDGFYERLMEGIGGYPILSPAGNDDAHLRALRHGLNKLFGKRADLRQALHATNAASQLLSEAKQREKIFWGWSPFVCSSYGTGEAILRESGIMLHEAGHQFQMEGAEVLDPDFRRRLSEVFNAGRRERLWMGDYGGSNMWENVAVCASWWVNDMTQDEGGVRPREVLRRSDPRVYRLLAEYWPGDVMIDLHATSKLQTDASGNVLRWGNGGGIEYFKPNGGWRFYERSVGAFLPSGKPALQTTAGVTAITFDGNDALTWDKTTWDALDGNRAWAVEAWACREEGAGSQTIMEWGAPGAKLLWGGDGAAFEMPGLTGKWTRNPAPRGWHHLAWVYSEGSDDAAGELRLYVDGKLDSSTRTRLNLPPQISITVGKGFRGSIAHLRVHNSDLHPEQIAERFEREAPAYRRESLVGARVLVDCDARFLAPVYDSETWLLYPATLGKPWLRSWANYGTLGGKLHNEASVNSTPLAGIAQGTEAISFDGKSRCISSFSGEPPATGSVEAWIFPEGDAGSVWQWGAWLLSAKALRPSVWQHAAVTFEKGRATLFINGTNVGDVKPNAAVPRLIIGSGFRGHIARLRVYDSVLAPEQLRQNAAAKVTPAHVAPPATRRAALLDLDAAALPAGPVQLWKNSGAARGSFTPASEREVHRPMVSEIEGRRGVDFSGRKSLVSSFAVPPELQGGQSFSIALRAYYADTRGLEREQTVLSWGRRPGERAEWRWGSSPGKSAFSDGAKQEFGFVGAATGELDRMRHNAPLPGGWRHIAWVYDGAAKQLRLYVDGKRNREESITLNIKPGELLCLGGSRTTRLADTPFSGMLGEVEFVGGALSDEAVSQLAKGAARTQINAPWLVWLDAQKLATGALNTWRNEGTLGGGFETEVETAPAVRAETIAGRAAVTFDGPNPILRSDFVTPPTLCGDKPFTVEMLVFNPKVAELETVFSMAPAVAMPGFLHDSSPRAAHFNYGAAKDGAREWRAAAFSSGHSSRNVGWKDTPPPPSQWQHIAYVYSGGYRGTFRLYVNGELVNERAFFALDTIGGHPLTLGAAWSTARGAFNPFSGSLARLRVYDYARTADEIKAAAG